MIVRLRHLFGGVVSVFRSRQDLMLEKLALRRQLFGLNAQRPRRRFRGDLETGVSLVVFVAVQVQRRRVKFASSNAMQKEAPRPRNQAASSFDEPQRRGQERAGAFAPAW